MLAHYVEIDVINLQTLNNIIENWKYSSIDFANKPVCIPQEVQSIKIKETASQNWCILHLLPLWIGDNIHIDDA